MNRSLRYFLCFFIGLVVFGMSSEALSTSKFRHEMLRNRYDVALSETDSATVYLEEDHTFVMVPNFTNKDYVHICWGAWGFKEKYQTLEIKNGEMCNVLNGEYKIERSDYGLVLRDSGKVLVFKYLLRPHRYSKKSK